MTNFYRNKTCLITGATGGLGKELVGFLVNNHSILILVGQNKKKLIELKKSMMIIKIFISMHLILMIEKIY